MVESAQRIGGDPLTLRILGEVHQAFNPDGKDDYLLVGKQIPYAPPVFESFTAGMPSYLTTAEAGYVITRKTAAYPTSPTTVSGILKPDHQGYYSPKLQAANAPGTEGGPFAQPLGASLASASLLKLNGRSVPHLASGMPINGSASSFAVTISVQPTSIWPFRLQPG
jgi:hypothetical protein